MIFYNEKIFKRCFSFPKKYWYKNIKYIPLYFKLMHHLIKHGYDEYATWETFDWFISTMRPILTTYRNSHIGYPVSFGESTANEEEVVQKYDSGLDRMIALLDDMDESNLKYEAEEYEHNFKRQLAEMDAAKNEFFKLFAEYFYNLWD